LIFFFYDNSIITVTSQQHCKQLSRNYGENVRVSNLWLLAICIFSQTIWNNTS